MMSGHEKTAIIPQCRSLTVHTCPTSQHLSLVPASAISQLLTDHLMSLFIFLYRLLCRLKTKNRFIVLLVTFLLITEKHDSYLDKLNIHIYNDDYIFTWNFEYFCITVNKKNFFTGVIELEILQN